METDKCELLANKIIQIAESKRGTAKAVLSLLANLSFALCRNTDYFSNIMNKSLAEIAEQRVHKLPLLIHDLIDFHANIEVVKCLLPIVKSKLPENLLEELENLLEKAKSIEMLLRGLL